MSCPVNVGLGGGGGELCNPFAEWIDAGSFLGNLLQRQIL